MARYRIIEFMKLGNMLVSRSEEEAIAIAIVFEQLIHARTLSPEMNQHIVEEMDDCGQVIFYYDEETIYVSKNHLGGKLIATNPFSVKDVEKHHDYSFATLIETAQQYGSQIDEIESIVNENPDVDMDDVLEDLMMISGDADETTIREQLESMLSAVSGTAKPLEYEVEISSIRDLLEEVYGNVNTGEQKYRS